MVIVGQGGAILADDQRSREKAHGEGVRAPRRAAEELEEFSEADAESEQREFGEDRGHPAERGPAGGAEGGGQVREHPAREQEDQAGNGGVRAGARGDQARAGGVPDGEPAPAAEPEHPAGECEGVPATEPPADSKDKKTEGKNRVSEELHFERKRKIHVRK